MSGVPDVVWPPPDCPVCGDGLRRMASNIALRCEACGIWWTPQGGHGAPLGVQCGSHATDSELRCIRRSGHRGDHAGYDQQPGSPSSKVVHWVRAPLERIADALRERQNLEMSATDFELFVRSLLDGKGVQ